MDAITLIDELRGANPIAGLKKFVETVESTSDCSAIVNDLLTVSPNCNDILQLLPKYNQDKKDLAVIFNSLGYVLMSIAKELPSFGSVGLHITRWILQNHCNLLHKLLVNVSQNTCTALHCITGMVTLGSAATFEVLSHLEFNSIKFGVLAEKRDETKLRDIRSCLFSLIFAFLTCEDCKCLRKVVRHHEMFTCVFSGLEHDPSRRIIRFLTYLRESIVLDAFIQKTTKIQIFNERTCKYLVKFYFHKDDNYNKNVDEDRDPEDKRIIKQALHNLMISLCSDLRYGVIFKDKKNNEANNKIVFYILTTINSPWEFEEGRELTNKILKACPDITKLFLNFISSYLEERPTWGYFSFLKLFALIIDTQTPLDTIEMQAEKGPLKEICFLTPFVNKKLILSLLENNSRILRHGGSLILLALFRKTKETLAKIDDIQRLTDNQKQELKNAVLICVEKIIKPIKFVCCWNIFLEEDFNSSPIWYKNEYKSKFGFLSTLTEVICIYAEIFDFQLIREFINPLNMLRKLLEFPKEEMTTDMVSYQTCLEHVLSLLLTGQKLGNFESFGFLKEDGADDGTILLNKYLFKQLISIYCLGNYNPGTNDTEISLKLQDICLSLLDASFSRWGLSLYCESYYKIWLDKIILKEFEKCSDFFAEVIIRTVSNQFAYLDILINQKEGKENNLECIDVLSEVEKANTSEVNDNEDMTVFSVTIPFSCLVVGASEVLRENPDEHLIRYFSSIVEEYIHCLQDPKSLGKYLLANEELISLTLKQYLLVWVSNEPVDDIQLSDDENLSHKLKYIFMTKQYPSSSSEFCKEIKSSLKDEKDLEQLCRQVLLYVQNEKKMVDLKKKKSLKFYLKVLRSLITTNEDELEVDHLSGVFKYLLQHSFILESYGMFGDSNIISSEVENIIFTVILKYPSLHYLLKPYLKKLFVALELCLSKEEGQNIDYLIHISPYLGHYSYISYADIEHMLTTCLTSPQSSETISNLINELLLLLLKSSTKYHRPSTKIIKMAFSKLVVLNQNKVASGAIEFPASVKNNTPKISGISPKPLPKAPGGRNSSPGSNSSKRSSGSTPVISSKSEHLEKENVSSGMQDLLSLDTPTSNGSSDKDNEDIFGDFLKAPSEAKVDVSPVKLESSVKEGSDFTQSEESNFFNQKLPEPPSEKLSKDSILALYSQPPSHSHTPTMFGGGMYMGGSGIPIVPSGTPISGMPVSGMPMPTSQLPMLGAPSVQQQNMMFFQQPGGVVGGVQPAFFPPGGTTVGVGMYPLLPNSVQLSAANPFAQIQNQMGNLSLGGMMPGPPQPSPSLPLGNPLIRANMNMVNVNGLSNNPTQPTTLSTNLWQ